MTRKKVKRCA